jgi:hypothetical protein
MLPSPRGRQRACAIARCILAIGVKPKAPACVQVERPFQITTPRAIGEVAPEDVAIAKWRLLYADPGGQERATKTVEDEKLEGRRRAAVNILAMEPG